MTYGRRGVKLGAMSRFIPPRQTIWLFVFGLFLLMAAGMATMRKFGPRGGQLYAVRHSLR